MRTIEQVELTLEVDGVQLRRGRGFWGRDELKPVKLKWSGRFTDLNYMDELLSMN